MSAIILVVVYDRESCFFSPDSIKNCNSSLQKSSSLQVPQAKKIPKTLSSRDPKIYFFLCFFSKMNFFKTFFRIKQHAIGFVPIPGGGFTIFCIFFLIKLKGRCNSLGKGKRTVNSSPLEKFLFRVFEIGFPPRELSGGGGMLFPGSTSGGGEVERWGLCNPACVSKYPPPEFSSFQIKAVAKWMHSSHGDHGWATLSHWIYSMKIVVKIKVVKRPIHQCGVQNDTSVGWQKKKLKIPNLLEVHPRIWPGEVHFRGDTR